MKKGKMSLVLLFSIILLCSAASLFAQRISVSNAKLMANGQQIWINGANTPWNNWNDFGGNYNSSWWNNEFARIKSCGGNATRIWMTCSGEVGINISTAGYVSGATSAHWANLDDMFALAQANQIYILATLISFDHTKNTYSTYQSWRNMYASTANMDSFATNYAGPFAARYKDNPYLFAIEPCNEIEWVNQNTDNAQASWATLQYFCAKVVAAVHQNSSILTTIGVSMKWQTDVYPNNDGNRFSDALLKAQYNSSYTYLDVYSPHFYDWVTDWFGNPMNTTNVSAYGLTDKPVIIGELPAVGVGGIGITACYENGYTNGLQGLMPWTSNGVDSNGSLDTGLCAALTSFKNNHSALVYPGGTVTNVPTTAPTTPPTDTIAPTTPPSETVVPTATPGPTSVPTATPVGVTADPTAIGTTPVPDTPAPTDPPNTTADPTSPPATGCTCPNLCTSTTAITVPFTFDGIGEFCRTSSSLGTYVNSWNTDAVNINGTNCTNTYIASSSISAISGVYYIYYKGSYSWSHVEVK